MVIETLLLALGTSTAKAVARIWIKGDATSDLSNVFIEQLAGRVPGILERRRTSRQFEEMADRVSQQLLPLVQHEPGGLPDNERDAAILGVAGVIDAVQAVNPDVLFGIDLEPTALEAVLRKTSAMTVRNDLIEPAQLLFDVLLRESCTYIIELAIALPQFTSQALVEILRRNSEIMERVDEVLKRLPKPALVQADADQEYDVRYRRHIARELDRLELFGLTLSDTSARYELSIAYITLGASVKEDDEAAAMAAKGVTDAHDTDAESGGEAYLRVDDALARGKRHLIRGEAGSGKTTLLQWLAVTASRQQFAGGLAEWKDVVPFFVQLRRYSNGRLPNPSQFLEHTAALIAEAAPNGWVDRKLQAGEGLVLIDGVDELPEHQRPDARDWLEALLAEYPDCRFVVTTRPPAVPEDWLDAANFGLFELLPMSLPDIDSFVQHWYDAARKASIHDSNDLKALDRYQRELTRVIRENASIRSLATAPLLCAMLCALNRDRRTQLPNDRMELYRIALESLLDRRDVEREISQHDLILLGLREKETLLQDLAYWLIINEQTDVAKDAAIERIKGRLAYMTSISSPAPDVFRHLLIRSGLIREPVEGRIDFIHRTFQEYLGAARSMKEGNIPFLVSRAHDDQWREVVILSAGHASAGQADELINGLIDRGSAEVAYKHRLHLLAVACLETAVELDPSTIDRVQSVLRGALPPTNMTEARAVASAGPVAAPLLAQYTQSYATTAAACVRALCLIGGEAALGALSAFASDRRVTVTRELIRGWDSFDREAYAAQILSDCSLDYGRIALVDPEGLSSVHQLKRMRSLSLTLRGSVADIGNLPNSSLVTDLNIPDASRLESLQPLTAFTRLRSLSAVGGKGFDSLPQLADSLEYLTLSQLASLNDIRFVAQQPALKNLSIFGCPVSAATLAGSSVADLTIQSVQTLGDGSWLATMPNLTELSVSSNFTDAGDEVSLGPDGSCEFLKDAHIRRLVVFSAGAIKTLIGLGDQVNVIDFYGAESLEDASALGDGRALTRVSFDRAARLQRFNFLSGPNRMLRFLDLEGAVHFRDLGTLAHAYRLNTLLLSATAVRDLAPIAALPNLRHLSLAGCPIESFEPLKQLRTRCNVTISADRADLVPGDLRRQHRWIFRDPRQPILDLN